MTVGCRDIRLCELNIAGRRKVQVEYWQCMPVLHVSFATRTAKTVSVQKSEPKPSLPHHL
jgi:hypothetical protein